MDTTTLECPLRKVLASSYVWDLGVYISDNADESFFWPNGFDHRDAFLQSDKFYQI